MNIHIETIPHSHHRYETVGDWTFDEWGDLTIKVSFMGKGNWKHELLVAVHELVEGALCKEHGVKEEDVTCFDIQFEKERVDGKHGKDEEPGSDPRAPYRLEHKSASAIERKLARDLGVSWKQYGDEVMSL